MSHVIEINAHASTQARTCAELESSIRAKGIALEVTQDHHEFFGKGWQAIAIGGPLRLKLVTAGNSQLDVLQQMKRSLAAFGIVLIARILN